MPERDDKLIYTSTLARRTGYSIREIAWMEDAGQITPATKNTHGDKLWDPNVLSPKPKGGRPILRCDSCPWYDNRWCKQRDRHVTYNRVACDNHPDKQREDNTMINLSSEVLKAIREERQKPQRKFSLDESATKSEPQPKSEPQLEPDKPEEQQVFDGTIKVDDGAKSADEVEQIAKKVVAEVEKKQPIRKPKRSKAKKEPAAEPTIEHTVTTYVDAREIIMNDLEEAQRALTLIDALRQIYGDAPVLEEAIVEQYKSRRSAV